MTTTTSLSTSTSKPMFSTPTSQPLLQNPTQEKTQEVAATIQTTAKNSEERLNQLELEKPKFEYRWRNGNLQQHTLSLDYYPWTDANGDYCA